MKICVITGIFPPDIGGPASYVPRIASALVERGHAVNVTTLSDSLSHDDGTYPFPVRRILRPQSKWKRMPETIRAIVADARENDVIFANGLYIECAFAKWFSRKPLVMKIVGDWAWERFAGSGRVTDTVDEFQVKRYCSRVEAVRRLRSWVTRRADIVFTPSRYLERIVLGWGVHPAKLRVIYNAVDEAPAQTAPASLPPFEGCTIVTVGRLVPWKGVDKLLQVVADLPSVRLVVVGDGPLRADLESQATALHLGNRALFTGRVAGDWVRAYLRASDVFVLNSTYEGLPHIVLEAMQVGIPVIATQTPGTAELIQHGITGLLVPPGNEEALRASLEVLLGDPDKRSRLADTARQRLEQSFQWEQLVGETESLLLSCAKKREGSQIAHE